MIFIDTGYLIAVLDPDDQLHSRAIEWGRALTARPQFTTAAVIIELFIISPPPIDARIFHSFYVPYPPRPAFICFPSMPVFGIAA